MNKNLTLFNIIRLILVCTGGALMLFPLFIVISTSLKVSGAEVVFPPALIPKPVAWENYIKVWQIVPFFTFLKNSVIITSICLIGRLFSNLLIGYAFARLHFPGRDILFMICISTMMLPGIVTIIPMFILYRMLGWVNTFLPLTVHSFFGSAFLIFMSRQFFRGIPMEYDEAARVDGANTLRIWWEILLPNSIPLVIVISIYSFLWDWNDFMHPLIYLHSQDKFTLALGLRTFMGYISYSWNYLMTGALIMIAPVILFFVFAQRYFIQGISMSGITGR
jgi:ABC-type glycerol-3-phosphate transport system permease component